MYAITGLSAIGAAFVAVALVLALFAVGYVAAYAVAGVAGIVYGLWLRSARPTVYQGIGLGARQPAALTRPATAIGTSPTRRPSETNRLQGRGRSASGS
jgi:hypothetical protein